MLILSAMWKATGNHHIIVPVYIYIALIFNIQLSYCKEKYFGGAMVPHLDLRVRTTIRQCSITTQMETAKEKERKYSIENVVFHESERGISEVFDTRRENKKILN